MYGKKLKELRNIEGWTQEEVAKKLGISKQTYSHYENEKRRPSLDTIRQLAAVYQVNIDDIFSEEKVSDLVMIPVFEKIYFEEGIISCQEINGYEPTPKEWLLESNNEYFYLRAKDNSMTGARIHAGALLLIRKQSEIENGAIAVVITNNETVLRRIYKNGDQLVLQSEHPDYPPIFATSAEAKIIGKLKMSVLKHE